VDSTLYVPFQEFFAFLRIKNESSADKSVIKGFYGTVDNVYEYSIPTATLVIGDSMYKVAPGDIMVRSDILYFSTGFFRKYFGIKLSVSFDNLNVIVASDERLPVIRILQRERVRKQRPGEVFAPRIDRTIEREYHWLDGAMLDWSLGYSQAPSSKIGNYGINLGAEILGGDFTTSIHGTTNRAYDWSNLPWRWRFVKDAYPFFRQVYIGDYQPLFGRSYSGKGLVIGNKLLYSRREYSTYHYVGHTKPNWDVELYLNSTLAGFEKADSLGSYAFDIPIPYGSLIFTMMYYGPNGEEASEQIRVDIPASFMPPNEIEYSLSAGELTAFKGHGHYQFLASYGLAPNMTFGVGFQYFKYGDDVPYSPVGLLSYRFPFNLIISAQHIQNVQSTVSLGYATAGETRIGAAFSRYYPSTMNAAGMLSQSQLSFGTRMDFVAKNTFYNLNLFHTSFRDFHTVSLNSGIGTALGNYTFFYTYRNQMSVANKGNPYFSSLSDFGAWTTVFNKYFVSVLISYNHDLKEMSYTQLSLNTLLFQNMQTVATFIYNFNLKSPVFQLDLQIPLDFARTTTKIVSSSNGFTFNESVAGSLGYDSQIGHIIAGTSSWVGQSALTMLPFLDENGNNERDPNEPYLESTVRTNTDRGYHFGYFDVDYSRVVGLEQYYPVLVSVDSSSLVDPVWIPRFKTLLVYTDPNQFKPVFLPIYYASQASGSVVEATPAGFEGVRDFKVQLRGVTNSYRDFAVTFSDGTFDYFGLPPGKYLATPDPGQMQRMGVVSYPSSYFFELFSKPEGDVIGRINFVLKSSAGPLIAERQDTLANSPEIPTERQRQQVVVALPDTATLRMQEVELTKLQSPLSVFDTTSSNRTVVIPDTAFMTMVSIDSSKLRPLIPLIESIRIPEPIPIVAARELPPEIGSATAPFLPQTLSIPINLNLRELDTNATRLLDRILATVRGKSNYIVRIEGHSDNFGSFAQNQTRSQQRADRAINYLVKMGVPRKNIQVQAFGSRRPIAPNTTAAGRAQNNRVDVTVIIK
jgi:hypothetical protein